MLKEYPESKGESLRAVTLRGAKSGAKIASCIMLGLVFIGCCIGIAWIAALSIRTGMSLWSVAETMGGLKSLLQSICGAIGAIVLGGILGALCGSFLHALSYALRRRRSSGEDL